MATPYRDKLYTNIVPSDDECRDIRELVAAPMQEIEELAVEIATLQATLDQLIRRRDGLSEFVGSHLALVSPVRRIPYDILWEIFTHSLPTDRYPTMRRSDSPLLLSSICSEWRGLALSMPRLWMSLHVVGPARNPLVRENAVNEGVKVWLARSRDLPLSISYTWMSSGGREDLNNCSMILETLVESAWRWSHMRFAFPSCDFFAPLGVLSSTDVPLFRTIVIDVGRTVPTTMHFFSVARGPSVQGISLNSPFFLSPALFPLGQLHHLSLLGDMLLIVLPDALEMLRQMPRLETCAMEIAHRSTPSTLQPISLNYLHQLCIIDSTRSGTAHIFNHIDVPNLRTLEYRS
ncbi:hypothetical protein B0H13DRAFT_1543351, partial [Mycena leptocephala]